MTFEDQNRRCVECGQNYTWSARDQRFAEQRGYLPPKRCPSCRERQKQRHRERLNTVCG